MIGDNLVNNRTARYARNLEKGSGENEQGASRACCKDQPRRENMVRRFCFAP